MTSCNPQLQALLTSFCTEADLCFTQFTKETKEAFRDYLSTQDGKPSNAREAFKAYRDCDRVNNDSRKAICKDTTEALRNFTSELGVSHIYDNLGLPKQAQSPSIDDMIPAGTRFYKGTGKLKDVIASKSFDDSYLDAADSCLGTGVVLNYTCVNTKRAALQTKLNDLASDIETNGCINFASPEQSHPAPEPESPPPQQKVWGKAEYLAALNSHYPGGSADLDHPLIGVDTLKMLCDDYC